MLATVINWLLVLLLPVHLAVYVKPDNARQPSRHHQHHSDGLTSCHQHTAGTPSQFVKSCPTRRCPYEAAQALTGDPNAGHHALDLLRVTLFLTLLGHQCESTNEVQGHTNPVHA